jgi:hypothetical protein
MPSYLERYRRGECEEVWAELLALGGQIRQEPLYSDALAVARDTMSRARENIKLLVPRLISLSYRFAHPEQVFVPAKAELRRRVADAERRAGPLPLSLQTWCEVVGEVNFMGLHPKLSAYEDMPSPANLAKDFMSLFAMHGGKVDPKGATLQQGLDLTQRMLGELMQRIRTGQPQTPEMLAGAQASKEFLEKFQRPGAAIGPDVDSDPLVVEPYFAGIEEDMEDSDEDESAVSYDVLIAPDPIHKTNSSGGDPYTIRIPDPAVDAILTGDEDYGTFVEYLRTCFRWGGFPGLRASANPPREEVAFLTQGLSPL